MFVRIIFLAALSSLLFSGTVYADVPNLTGSAIKLEDALLKSDAVFVGEISTMGFVTSEKPYQMGVTVTNVDGIQGLAKASPWGAMVLFTVSDVAGEVLPQVNSSYIFCVMKNEKEDAKIGPDKFTALKLLPATPANVAMVKNLAGRLPTK